jgi:pimeloyl-ACP methyl ester carboxylesterase
MLMLAGRYDPIVTPDNVQKLWRAWDKPALHWYRCGHGTIAVYYREVVREILQFLQETLLEGA